MSDSFGFTDGPGFLVHKTTTQSSQLLLPIIIVILQPQNSNPQSCKKHRMMKSCLSGLVTLH